MTRRLTLSTLLAWCGLFAAALVGYHFALRHLMRDGGLRLGAVSYKLAPLYAYWRPHLKGWLVIPVAFLAVYFAWLRRTRLATGLRDGAAACCYAAFFVAIAAGVAMLDNGPRSLIAPLLRTDLEYYGAVDRVDGVGRFLRDYPEQATTMPMHAQVHPPGAVLFVWAASSLAGGGAWGAAAAIILTSALSAPIVFLWARRLGGPGVARRAAAIYVLVPSTVLFTATSMDGVFAVPLIATMWLFWESLERNAAWFAAASGAAAGVAALMTYSVVIAIAFCGAAAGAAWVYRPAARRTVLWIALTAIAAFVGFHVLLWLVCGYDPLAMFGTAIANARHIMRGTAHETTTRHVHLAIGNLAAFAIGVGVPCAVVACAGLVDRRRENSQFDNSTAHPFNTAAVFAVAAASTLVIAALLPAYHMEVERVWMFLVPLVVMPVAQRLFDQEQRTGRIQATLAVALVLAAQTVITEVLLTTYW